MSNARSKAGPTFYFDFLEINTLRKVSVEAYVGGVALHCTITTFACNSFLCYISVVIDRATIESLQFGSIIIARDEL